MKTWMRVLTVLAVSVMLLGGTALALDKPAGCEKAGTPEKVEGRIVQMDPEKGTLTVRATDGTTHVFQASKETLQEYKVGDTIKATLRSAPKCP